MLIIGEGRDGLPKPEGQIKRAFLSPVDALEPTLAHIEYGKLD